MGIEPLLLVGIVLAMFVVQLLRAAHTALADRLEYAMLTMDGAGRHAERRAMAPEALPAPVTALVPVDIGPRPPGGTRTWTEARPGGLLVKMVASRLTRPILCTLRHATGVWQRSPGEHRRWFAPSILVVVRLPHSVAPGLRMGARTSVVASSERIPLHSPVLDQIVRVAGPDPELARRLLKEPALHEPLIELLAVHPLSVITGDAVALWCAQAVNDPEPLVELAEEVARAMLAVAEPPDRG